MIEPHASGGVAVDLENLRSMEGSWVNIALVDGSRVDASQLIGVARHDLDAVWFFANGVDAFVRIDDITDVWEAE